MNEFLAKLNAPFKELWQNHKIFLICFGLLIIFLKFKDVIFDLIVKSSKEMLDKSYKQDQVLKNEQDSANNKANELIKEANNLDNNKPTVDENWHKNDKK